MMFFSILAALAIVPWAQALLLQIPVGWQSSSDVNITWSAQPSDPTFSLQLFNTDEFHDTFSIANNLPSSAGFASFQLGVIPQGTYTLRAINVTNAGQIYDETPAFTIQGPPPESSRSLSSSTASSSSPGSTSPGGSSTLTVSRPGTTSGFGVTVSASSTPNGASETPSTTSTGGGSAPSNFNGGGNGAASLPRIAPLALTALGVVAGVAFAL